MSFDQTDPDDLLALKTEVNDDPIIMGYAAVVDQTEQLRKLLNDEANNVEIPKPTANTLLTSEVLLQTVDEGEYDGNQVGEGRGLFDLFVTAGLDGEIDLEQFRAKIRTIFPPNGATVANIDGLLSPLSRAEVLFGQGTEISRSDWFAARDS